MKAIGYRAGPEPVLRDVELPVPVPGPRDLLLAVKAISINPIDVKVAKTIQPEGDGVRVLGFDAASVVREVGSEATLFRPGDEVMYAGHFDRQGSNAQYQIVDERLVGPKPKTLSFPEAAALPLTSITAYELLFDRMGVPRDAAGEAETLLVIGGSGGVGSIAIQLAVALTKLRVVATASNPQSRDWCREMGAHAVIDHSRPLEKQLADIGVGPVRYIASLSGSDSHLAEIAAILAPEGKVGIIDDVHEMDFAPFKRKCATVAWEFMFARGLFQTPDMARQHDILVEVSRLVDVGVLRTTMTRQLGTINAQNLQTAHSLIARGGTPGKMVLSGFA